MTISKSWPARDEKLTPEEFLKYLHYHGYELYRTFACNHVAVVCQLCRDMNLLELKKKENSLKIP
jgi:hypothetical protein